MKLAVLFSGGKDSTYATWIAKKYKPDVVCLISVMSDNKDSYMFHTPLINLTERQSRLMNVPLIKQITKGDKEVELKDLEKAIKRAKEEYNIEGIVTGAVESVYQASRIQKICDKLDLDCFNPLWQKDQIELLNELINNKFEIIISKVAAYPLDKKWVGRKIDKEFVKDMKKFKEKFNLNPAGEGGEFETLVINCPLFSSRLEVYSLESIGEENSWTLEVDE